jgi:N-acyl homoserine lactone hydrolase
MPARRMYFQNHGFLGCDLRWFLVGKDFASGSNREPPTSWYHAPTNTIVIDHPEGPILFDTSCPRDWRDRWEESGNAEWNPYESVTDDQFLDSSLKRIGLEPGDFKLVVLSHLHFDHAGNLALFKDTDATLIAQKAEKEGALSIPGSFAGAHLRDDYEGYAFETVSGDAEIADGVRLLLLPGHTWGTMGIMFDLPNTGTVICTSDAVYMDESIGPPAVPDPIAWSSLDWLSSVERVRRLAEKHDATLFFGHDHNQVTGGRRIAPEFYD